MNAQKRPQFAFIAMCLCLAQVTCAPQPAAAKSKTSKSIKTSSISKTSTTTVVSDADDAAAVRAHVNAISDNLARADAKNLAALWAEDGSYVNEDGAEFKGRAALEKQFGALFASEGRQLLELATSTVRPIASNVMLASGVVRRSRGSAQPVAQTRFTIVLVKQNGGWAISSATETPYVEMATVNPLSSLSWLIGDWSADGDGGSVKMQAQWCGNENFIDLKFLTKKSADGAAIESRQIVGWDPRTQQPVSWSFDANGGFGYGDWVKKESKWIVKSNGVDRDGSISSSTNIMTIDGPNNFTWQSENRTVNGVVFSDTAPLKVQRVSK